MERHTEAESPPNRGPITVDQNAMTVSRACDFLLQAEIRSCGLLFGGSNYVFLATLCMNGEEAKAIYKPRQGEAPLWDFPNGTLYKREYAAFIISRVLEWHFVPPTIIRNGPHGIGSWQWFVTAKSNYRDYPVLQGDAPALKQVAVFDYLVNNADRKASHLLEDRNGRLWLVDHGLTFNSVPQLRTVLWNFAGQPIPEDLLVSVKLLRARLKQDLRLRETLLQLLQEDEVEAFESRIETIIDQRVFVRPGSHRSVPWPWM